MILYDTQHWWTKNCRKWMWQWFLWRLDVFEDLLRVFLTMMVHASSLQPRQNPNCSKKPCGVTYISRPCCSCIWSRLLKHCFFFKFTIPLLLFICTSLCFVSYILFKIQKWCEALVKFSEIYNFNFCIFLLMFLAYDVDVIAF